MTRRPPISTLFPYTPLFRSVIIDSQKIAEEKGFVLDDGPADIGPVIVVGGQRLRRDRGVLEERHGRQRADAVDFVRGAVKLVRSEEHTSELQSRPHLVCRLL